MSMPGLDPRRMVRRMEQAVRRCDLRMNGLTVLTEAATGAYAATPVLAALAGARVMAVARDTRYGTAALAGREVEALAAMAAVRGPIEVLRRKTREAVEQADIVTNSGHLRPLDAGTVAWMKSGAVIPLMYEAWECRRDDIDLNACRARGIPVAGTDERHPAVGVSPYLGIMAARLLLDAGIPVYGSRILVLADNPFGPYLVEGLQAMGAEAECAAEVAGFDAVLVARRPSPGPALSPAAMAGIARHSPGVVVVQFCGDLDRVALAHLAIPFWPVDPPPPGHMGVLPSDVGPEPVIRLQAGGLKVGQVMAEAMRGGAGAAGAVEAVVASGFGQEIGEPA